MSGWARIKLAEYAHITDYIPIGITHFFQPRKRGILCNIGIIRYIHSDYNDNSSVYLYALSYTREFTVDYCYIVFLQICHCVDLKTLW